MPMDYFVWVIVGEGRSIIVDTGFTAETAAARKRSLIYPIERAFSELGIDVLAIKDVILTHLHYDHAGQLDLFPSATFHVQTAEVRSVTGPDMRHNLVRDVYRAQDVMALVAANFKGRVRFVDGDSEFAPGISLHLFGGHSRGLQGVRVQTNRGWVMLASDALHYYENLLLSNPFPIFVDLPGILQAGERALSLSESGDHLIPGHDPSVMQLFPRWKELEHVVEVSAEPLTPTPLSRIDKDRELATSRRDKPSHRGF